MSLLHTPVLYTAQLVFSDSVCYLVLNEPSAEYIILETLTWRTGCLSNAV